METNYKKILLNTIQENQIKKLPPKEILSIDEEIAIACWQSFEYDYHEEYENFSYVKWYNSGNWKDNLESYKNNMAFWDKALSVYQYELVLFSEEFKKDFPLVVESILNNNEKLTEVFLETKDKKYFNLIKLDSEQKNKILKDAINLGNYSPSYDEILNFIDDKEFFEKALHGRNFLYDKLSEEDKNKKEYIEIIIKNFDGINFLSKENRKNYYQDWLNIHKNSNNFKIHDYSEKEWESILALNPHFFSMTLDKQFSKYKNVALKMLQENFYETLAELNINQLIKIVENDDDYKKIEPILLNFIQGFQSISSLTNVQNKVIKLISLNENLLYELNKNVYFRVSNYKNIDFNTLEDLFEVIYEKHSNNEITIENANKNLNIAVRKLEVSVQKEYRFAKGTVFDRLSLLKLKRSLDNNLESKNNKPKTKI